MSKAEVLVQFENALGARVNLERVIPPPAKPTKSEPRWHVLVISEDAEHSRFLCGRCLRPLTPLHMGERRCYYLNCGAALAIGHPIRFDRDLYRLPLRRNERLAEREARMLARVAVRGGAA